ncbi:MAG: hypoxanthine phosphoribosyltransferase [Clostridia bacterium]|nr:hypoxanthine phosphoribosyltransferase [Clostridia bacterium]
MMQAIERVLISEEDLQKKVQELADCISQQYEGKDPLLITVLKGGFVFAADLFRRITIPASVDFMAVSSYGASSKSSGVVKIIKDLDHPVEGRDVIIIEDILDSGMTLSYLRDMLLQRGVKSLKICTILNKPDRRKADINADYVGFDIPDEFVVGYGLDYAEKYRNLPFVGILKREIYENE